MTKDSDIEDFLEKSCAYMNVDALQRDWESYFVNAIAQLKIASSKERFKRGFAKAVLGQVSADEYERETGWCFDTEDEFRAHLRKYWRMFYGDDKPEEVVAHSAG